MNRRGPVVINPREGDGRQEMAMARQSRAFTLIELLVVIAIIAVLMGILMPVLRTAREQAWDVICRSNLKQVGMAAHMYAQDWEQRVPRGVAGDASRAWYNAFMPYLAQKLVDNDYRNVKIYRCPSYPDKEQTVCYVVNGWGFKDRRDRTGYEIVGYTPVTDCRRPAETLYLADNEDGPWRAIIRTTQDEGVNRLDVFHPDHLPHSSRQEVLYGRRVARSRHKGKRGCNTLWLDWHVDYMDAEKMTIDMWRWKK